VVDHFLAFLISFRRDLASARMILLAQTLPGCDMRAAFVRLPMIASTR